MQQYFESFVEQIVSILPFVVAQFQKPQLEGSSHRATRNANLIDLALCDWGESSTIERACAGCQAVNERHSISGHKFTFPKLLLSSSGALVMTRRGRYYDQTLE